MDRLSQAAVLIHLNTDETPTKPISKQFHLGGIPTVVVIDPKGQEVDRIIGYDDDRSAWLKTLLGYMYGIDTVDDMLARYALKPGLDLAKDLAQKYLDRGDGTDALSWVDKARTFKPSPEIDSSLTLIQGKSWLITDPPKGVDALMSLAADPKSPLGDEAFDSLSAHYKREARNATSPDEKAKAKAARLDVFHKVVAARPEDSTILSEYAWYCAGEGIELDKALASAQKAVQLKKDDPELLDTLAEVYFKMGKKQDAVSTIEKAIQLNPDESYFKTQKEKFLKGEEEKSK